MTALKSVKHHSLSTRMAKPKTASVLCDVILDKYKGFAVNDPTWHTGCKERTDKTWQGKTLNTNYVPEGSARGFTDHEHLDNVGLIHMNGRVFDPEIGRFLSPDPLVQAPLNTQSYNRYSYVFNNPLSFTDPSGYQTSCIRRMCTPSQEFGKDQGEVKVIGHRTDQDGNRLGDFGANFGFLTDVGGGSFDGAYWQNANEFTFEELSLKESIRELKAFDDRYGFSVDDIFNQKTEINGVPIIYGTVPDIKSALRSLPKLFKTGRSQAKKLIGREYPTKKGHMGKQQPYDPKTGRFLSHGVNPGPVMSPAGRFSAGFAQGMIEAKGGGVQGSTPVGRAGDIEHMIGVAIGNIF